MEELNDDCQLRIISYLNIIDQLCLFEATNEVTTSRLNSNVIYIWQHQQRFTLDSTHFLCFNQKPALMNNFLSIISPTVQELDLHYITLDYLKRLTPYKFEQVISLEYTINDDHAESDGNLVILLIAELFPGLTSVKPYGIFDCIHLNSLKYLRNLDMSECWCLTHRFECEKMGELKSLEELVLPNQGFETSLYERTMLLPKLRKLTYNMNCEQIEFVTGMRAKDIERITFNDCIWEFKLPALQSFINLRQLTLLEDDGFTNNKLQELITALTRLERLDLIKFQLWRSEIDLWETVACCPSLKILNISGMQLYSDFFNSNRRLMEKILDKRSMPLTLHCHDTGEYEDLVSRETLFLLTVNNNFVYLQICLYFRHPKLKITFEPLNINYIDEGVVEIHFLPFEVDSS